MEEKETAAVTAPSPDVDAAEGDQAPAEPAQPSPDEARAAKYESELATLRADLSKTREEALESGRRAQRAADSHASRLEKRIERLTGLLDEVATRGLEEPEARAWKYRQEAERERERNTVHDAEAQQRKAEEDFRTYSVQVLTEEKINSADPVFQEAWQRLSAAAKDPAEWRAALGRSVAAVRTDELRKAKEETKVAEQKAREDERAKARNEKRVSAGPTDQGSVGAVSRKPYIGDGAMSDEEFARDSAEKKAARDRRLMGIGR